MRIADILRSKGTDVATVTRATSVTRLLAELALHNVGAMVVIGPPGGQERSDSGISTGGQERSDSGISTGGRERSDSGISTGGVLGIVSERDVVRQLHEQGPDLLRKEVGDIMSTVVVACGLDDHIDDLAALMTDNRIRHIPVLDAGRLIGIVSIGDVVKNRMEELQAEQAQLHAYITQGG